MSRPKHRRQLSAVEPHELIELHGLDELDELGEVAELAVLKLSPQLAPAAAGPIDI